MKFRYLMIFILSFLLCYGMVGCGETEQKVEEPSVEDYVDVTVEEPSEDDSETIPETEIELE